MTARPAWKHRWEAKRKAVFSRDRWLCQQCLRGGRYVEATEVDHIIPRSIGGDEALNNLEAICTDCHSEKSKREANKGYRPRHQIGLDGWPTSE
jgi:5-methylcytosine-specific restriction protein A